LGGASALAMAMAFFFAAVALDVSSSSALQRSPMTHAVMRILLTENFGSCL
jgi:hypothetical protein